MFLVPINYFAILVCGMLSMVIGFAWYGPLFGKEWMKLVGMTKDHMDKMSKDKDAMMKTYGASFVSSLLMAYALAHFIWFTAPGSTTMLVGVKTAIWAWVGFILPYALSKAIYAVDKKPMKLFWIDTGYYLALLLAMGIVLGIWW